MFSLNIEIREWLKEWRHSKDCYGNKLDSNGYGKSILSDNENPICYKCEKMGDLARHEVYQGKNRKTSKAMGFWIYVCPHCHEMYHQDSNLSKQLKKTCQERFELKHPHKDFMDLIGRNYL